jgi:hypothetical protein
MIPEARKEVGHSTGGYSHRLLLATTSRRVVNNNTHET